MVDHLLARLGVHRLLEYYLPAEDRRLKLGPAAAPFDPALLGLADAEVALLNDDRVGWGGCWLGCSTPTGPAC